jgi:hypothetical protein
MFVQIFLPLLMTFIGDKVELAYLMDIDLNAI